MDEKYAETVKLLDFVTHVLDGGNDDHGLITAHDNAIIAMALTAYVMDSACRYGIRISGHIVSEDNLSVRIATAFGLMFGGLKLVSVMIAGADHKSPDKAIAEAREVAIDCIDKLKPDHSSATELSTVDFIYQKMTDDLIAIISDARSSTH